ncbi:hypothetical protein DL768_006479 [Monosporascus sp. mg162]|nr:hypothetical protein DL768_006479 [Monosporascus sp. mg162]
MHSTNQSCLSGSYAPATTASGCTEVGRRQALSAWTAYLHVVESHLVSFGFRASLGSATRDDIFKTGILDTSWTMPWANRTFASSIEAKTVENNNARDVGFLSSLTTIFVPQSPLTGILFMGADFADGQNRFGVFWAFSVPLSIIGLVFLFTPIARFSQGGTGRLIGCIKEAFDSVKPMWEKCGKR